MDAQGVRAVVLDASLLFRVDSNGSVDLVADASRLLLRLRYSNLFLGILSPDNGINSSSRKQEALLEKVGVLGAIRTVSISQDLTVRAALENLGSEWGAPTTSSVYLSANQNEVTEAEVSNLGWTIVHFVSGSEETGSPRGAVVDFEQLQEIPTILASLNKKALGTKSVVVGHTMKWSRELDLLKRGAFPMVPNEYGLSFVPLHLDRPLEKQLADVDVVLQKATDEISSILPGQSGFPDSVIFSKGMLDLQRYLQGNPNICVVDPIDRVLPLLDRVATQNILLNLKTPFEQIIRSPRSVETLAISVR